MTHHDRTAAIARVVALEGFTREHGERPGLWATLRRVAYQVYVVLLVGGLYGGVVLRTLDTPELSSGVVPDGVASVAPAATMALAVLAVLVGVRLGSWAGPVLVSRPDAAWLLPAPLDRRRLLRRDLGWGLAGYGLAGGLLGLQIASVVAAATRSGLPGPVPATFVAWTSLGVTTGALALWVESSPRRGRAALRGTPVFLLVGAGLVWLAAVAPGTAAWLPLVGWASDPVIATSTGRVPLAALPPVLSTLLAGAAAWWSYRQLALIPDEELVRRAGTVEGVKASATVFDARAIAQARRSGQRRLVGHRTVRLTPPRPRWLLVPWRDLVSLLRRRGMLERTLVAVLAAVGIVAWSGGAALALVVAVLLGAAAAGQLLEPFRVELEQPVLGALTPLTPEGVSLGHLAVPVVALTVSGVVGAVLLAALGWMSWSVLPAACVGAVGLAAVLTGAAALTSTRGAPPLHLLVTGGDYGVIVLVGWLLAGPLLALAVTMPLVLSTLHAIQQGTPPIVGVRQSATTAVLLAAAFALATRWRVGRRAEAD